MTSALLGLQVFHVLFLALHDWVPLGRLNDLRAVRAADPIGKLLVITIASTLPVLLGLAASVYYAGRPYPAWLLGWLGVCYVGLLLGLVRAWWVPYLLRPEPARAARYAAMFGHTQAFLPEHNGIRPNTLHVVWHAATLVTVVLLAAVVAGRL